MRVLDTPVCCEDCQELHSVSTSGAGRGYVTSMSIPFELHHLVKRGEQVMGARARDEETGNEFEIHAKAVVNATGVFADEVRRPDDPGASPVLAPSHGAQIVGLVTL